MVTPSLNVYLASQLFPPFFAGAALRFLRYMPGLQARGIQAKVFSQTPTLDIAAASGVEPTWQTERSGTILPSEAVGGIPVFRVRSPDTGDIQRDMTYGRSLYQFCQRPDSRPDVIQHLSKPLWATPWFYRMRPLKIPTVLTLTLPGQLSSSPLKRTLQRQYWRLPFQAVDRVVVSSGVVKEIVQSWGVTTPIDIIPNGVDLEWYRPAANHEERQLIRQQLGIEDDAPVVITVGAVDPRKGTDFLLESWVQVAQSCPHSHLVIAGPRQDLTYPDLVDFRQKLERFVAASPAPERIHFVGSVDNVEEYLRAADLFVFASKREGMGNVLLEAMAAGLPVMTTPFLGLPEEIGQPDQHYLLVERDPLLFSQRIQQILTDKALHQRISQAGLDWVQTHLGLEKSIDQYANLYRELAEQAKVR